MNSDASFVSQTDALHKYCNALKLIDMRMELNYPCEEVMDNVSDDESPSVEYRNAKAVLERIRTWHQKMLNRHRRCCGNFSSDVSSLSVKSSLQSFSCIRRRLAMGTHADMVVWVSFISDTAKMMNMVEMLESLSTPIEPRCKRLNGCVQPEEIDCFNEYFNSEPDKILFTTRDHIEVLMYIFTGITLAT